MKDALFGSDVFNAVYGGCCVTVQAHHTPLYLDYGKDGQTLPGGRRTVGEQVRFLVHSTTFIKEVSRKYLFASAKAEFDKGELHLSYLSWMPAEIKSLAGGKKRKITDTLELNDKDEQWIANVRMILQHRRQLTYCLQQLIPECHISIDDNHIRNQVSRE